MVQKTKGERERVVDFEFFVSHMHPSNTSAGATLTPHRST